VPFDADRPPPPAPHTYGRIDRDGIVAGLLDRLEDLLDCLLGPCNRALSNRDERRYRSRGSLRVWVRGPKKGFWSDFEGDDRARNVLDLIMQLRHCSFREALEWAAAWLGSPGNARPIARPRSEPKPKHDQPAKTRRYAQRLFGESVPVLGTLAERYLREHRGIAGPLPVETRFHPAVWSKEAQRTFPAWLLPAFEGSKLRRVQAVFLDPETAAKAKLEFPKVTFGADASHVPVVFAGTRAISASTRTCGTIFWGNMRRTSCNGAVIKVSQIP
jgi:hypothetical protein